MEETGESNRKREGDDGAPDEESAKKRMRANVNDDGNKKRLGSGEDYKRLSSCGTQGVVAETWERVVEHMRSRFRRLLICRTPNTIYDIPSEIVFLVFLRVPGNFHCLRMSCGCREWRHIFPNNFHLILAELSWLLMPSSTTIGSMTYKLPLPPVIKSMQDFVDRERVVGLSWPGKTLEIT